MDVREADARQATGQVADDLYADFAQPEDGHHRDSRDDYDERHRPAGKHAFEQRKKRHCRNAEQQRRKVGLRQRRNHMGDAVKKISRHALEPNSFGNCVEAM
jgi:hypothetical protein